MLNLSKEKLKKEIKEKRVSTMYWLLSGFFSPYPTSEFRVVYLMPFSFLEEKCSGDGSSSFFQSGEKLGQGEVFLYFSKCDSKGNTWRGNVK